MHETERRAEHHKAEGLDSGFRPANKQLNPLEGRLLIYARVGEVTKLVQLDPLYPMDFDSDICRDPFG